MHAWADQAILLESAVVHALASTRRILKKTAQAKDSVVIVYTHPVETQLHSLQSLRSRASNWPVDGTMAVKPYETVATAPQPRCQWECQEEEEEKEASNLWSLMMITIIHHKNKIFLS